MGISNAGNIAAGIKVNNSLVLFEIVIFEDKKIKKPRILMVPTASKMIVCQKCLKSINTRSFFA